MTFITHRVGGNWVGAGAVDVPNCNNAHQGAIIAAFNNISSFALPCLTALGGLDRLVTCLQGKTVDSMQIDCNGPGCAGQGLHGADAARGGNSINFCDRSLPGMALQAETNSTLFHELIHSCDGGELDAYALQVHCYHDRGVIPVIESGALTSDFRRDSRDVGGGLRAGTFVVWEQAAGKVFVKVEMGGTWLTPATISRGAELSVGGIFR